MSDTRRQKSLENENRQLRNLLVELMLHVATPKEALGKFRHQGQGSTRDLGIEEECYSPRRACGLVGFDAKACRYASRRPDDTG
jgi:hypothetical protein